MKRRKGNLKVVPMREISLREVAKNLRAVADQVEAGEYGDVRCCGLAMLGDEFYAFGFGDGVNGESVSPSVALLFQAGVTEISETVRKYGRT